MTMIPMGVGFVGMILGGRLTDWLTHRIGKRWGRALPIGCSRYVAMCAYIYCLTEPGPWAAVAAFSVVAFATDLGVGAIWAYVQDVGGRRVGSVLGWGNMWGNLGATVTPPLLIYIVGDDLHWNAGFATCACAFFVAGTAGLGIDARRTISD
jgi:MFS transporter, ACS family, glucarate transporter